MDLPVTHFAFFHGVLRKPCRLLSSFWSLQRDGHMDCFRQLSLLGCKFNRTIGDVSQLTFAWRHTQRCLSLVQREERRVKRKTEKKRERGKTRRKVGGSNFLLSRTSRNATGCKAVQGTTPDPNKFHPEQVDALCFHMQTKAQPSCAVSLGSHFELR